MNSLEIVNNTIVKRQTIEIKGTDRLPSIFVDDIRIAGVKWNDSPNVGYITAKLNIHSRVISMENLETIKPDLEVLKLIKIKNVNLYSIRGFLNMHKKYSMILEDVLKAYNLNYPKLTLEELLKLKQWLEEHEHDNKSL